MTQISLLCTALAASMLLIGLRVQGPVWIGASGHVRQLAGTAIAALSVSGILLVVSRHVSSPLVAVILVTYLTLTIPLTDTPHEVIAGRSVFWFILPIVLSGMLIRPWATFCSATLASATLTCFGLMQSPKVFNWLGVVELYVLATLVWMSLAAVEATFQRRFELASALVDSEQRYRGVFENSMNGIGLHDLIRDEAGKPIDYRFARINRAFEEQTGLSREVVIGRTARETIPGIEDSGFIETYGRVVDTGKPLRFQQHHEPLGRTFEIAAFGVGADEFVTIFSDISERVRYDSERENLLAEMRRQAQELHSVLEAVPVAVMMLSESREVLMANALAETMLADAATFDNDSLASLAGQPMAEILHGPALHYWQSLQVGEKHLEVSVRPLDHEDHGGWVLVVRDVTHEREFEQRLQQQDRLAVIGQLAGGVAHDFNNLLTTILGFSEFALEGASEHSGLYEDISEVREAALRAAALTQQLLAFSRRQLLQPKTVSLCQVVSDMQRMLVGLLEEAIELLFDLTPDAANITVDPVQIQQVIMNLVVNARDAMPSGGRLTLGVHKVTVASPAPPPHAGVAPGEYVVLSVTDTGIGMNDHVKTHLFEPFFTTKDVGKGTGLGLSTVYGIVRQSEGRITVESAHGEGSTFRVYFPPALDGGEEQAADPRRNLLPTGDEVILLVEDEAAVRRLARRELESLGYVVLEAERPSVALALSRAAQEIDLLLTDVVMPEMDGTALATAIRQERPSLRVLYVSGYTDRDLDQIVKPGSRARFMEKPYRGDDLAVMVRAILDEA